MYEALHGIHCALHILSHLIFPHAPVEADTVSVKVRKYPKKLNCLR